MRQQPSWNPLWKLGRLPYEGLGLQSQGNMGLGVSDSVFAPTLLRLHMFLDSGPLFRRTAFMQQLQCYQYQSSTCSQL